MKACLAAVASAAVLFSACSGSGTPQSTPPDTSMPAQSTQAGDAALSGTTQSGDAQSAVLFTLSNQTASNSVLRFVRRGGTLTASGSFDTQGRGDPTISGQVQGALAFSSDRRFLFAVDAGSNEITSFAVDGTMLQFVGKVASFGMQPASLTVHDNVLYVLNEKTSTIHGFHVMTNGQLVSIDNSTRALSEPGTVGGAEIAFDLDGDKLVVTEKNTNRIDTYNVGGGIARGPTVHDSSGQEPFGFAFVPDQQTLVVSEAFAGAADKGAASSYDVKPDGFTPLTRSAADDNAAPCWFVITSDGATGFTSNTGSATISSYAIGASGMLALTHAVAGNTDAAPADLALVPKSRMLGVLTVKGNTVELFNADSSGGLTMLAKAAGLPMGGVGLAAL